jgi:hypothetical protein
MGLPPREVASALPCTTTTGLAVTMASALPAASPEWIPLGTLCCGLGGMAFWPLMLRVTGLRCVFSMPPAHTYTLRNSFFSCYHQEARINVHQQVARFIAHQQVALFRAHQQVALMSAPQQVALISAPQQVAPTSEVALTNAHRQIACIGWDYYLLRVYQPTFNQWCQRSPNSPNRLCQCSTDSPNVQPILPAFN